MAKRGRPPLDRNSTVAQPGAVGTTIRLPTAYMQILEAEAKRLGLRRGAFLQLLLQRKRGEVSLERAKDVKTYGPFTTTELTTPNQWVWYLSPELREVLEADCLTMGLTSMSAWITQTLNAWLGTPGGLTRKEGR